MLFLKVLLFFLILWFLRPDSWFSNAWDWQFPKIQHIFFLASWVPQDSSGQESLCISPLEPLSPAVLNTIFHLPFRWKRFLPVLQVLLHPFIHHLSVEMDKVWQATFILKTYFPISVIFTHASLQLIHRDTSEDWVIRHKSSNECPRTVRICFCQTVWFLCQIPHHSLRFDEAECFGEYCWRLPTSPLKLKKAWNIIFNFMILSKVSYLFRISLVTEIDFLNLPFHCTLFFQIHLPEKIKGTGTETMHRSSARYHGCLKFIIIMN